MTRSRDTRSREIQCVLRDPTGFARTWWYPCKTFCSVYIRAAPLVIKKIAILLQTPTQSFSWMTTIQLCLLQLFHIASVSGSWEARFVAAHVHSLIWAATKHALLMPHWCLPCENGVKDIQICIQILLFFQKEQHSLFNHTSFFCYRFLNNRSARDAPNVWQPKLWLSKREDRINCTEQWRDTIK